MSPVLSHGPTRPRSTSASVEGPISTENDTRAGIMETLRGTHRIFPHIDDLMGTRPIVDVNWHIKRLINEGESFAKQVDTQLDFRRLDIALQEHIKATVVATEIIPRHRDYPSLQAERGVLYRAYSGLMKRITAQNSKIDAVIGLIKEQNAKSGVQPTTGEEASKEFSRPPIDGNDGSMFMRSPNGATSSITSNGHQDGEIPNDTPVSTSSFTNGNAVRKKPAVQPKPNGLHGNALKRAGENISPQIDLVARFARLRSPDPPSPVQDPRIRTQPISFPPSHNGLSTATPKSSTIIRPSGPREMPSAPTSPLRPYTVSLDVHLQGMPRPPDAIYSPDRNTDSLATVNLPTSIPRNSSYLGNGNKVSAPPISTVGPTPSATDSRKDYFSASDDTSGPGHSPTAPKRQALEIPDGTTVTAEELLKYIQMGSQTLRILVVDLRSREEFDSGHIMAQSIICVEPIALRDGMSAEELGESIVVSPENEQRLYEQRHQFDLITFYDQSSSSINSTKQSSNNYLLNFSKAVFEYGYSKQAKRRPRILLGGLDAWIDLMSTGSLQTSSTAPSSSTALLRSAPKFSRPFGRVSVARDARKVSARARKPVDSRLSKEEEKQWAQTLREDPREKNSDDENPYLDEFSYVKTTEDFLRKYPELPSIQESMISTRSALSTKNYHDEAFNSLPMPPTRPAPALPRQRSSGISEKGPTPFAMSAGNGPGTISRALHAPGLTGLDSTGVHCYVNAALQCLSATPPFRDYLLNTYEYNANFLPPRKAKEDSKPPQLLTRNLQKVIRYLWTSHYEFISPRTFWGYVLSIHAKTLPPMADRNTAFCGTALQHDSQEFLEYIINVLQDELNFQRDRPDYSTAANLPDKERHKINLLPIEQAAQIEWQRYKDTDNSIIGDVFVGMTVTVNNCQSCPYVSKKFDPWYMVQLKFPDECHVAKGTISNSTPRKLITLEELLAHTWDNEEKIDDYTCEKCHVKGDLIRRDRFAVLPEYLVLYFPRFETEGGDIIGTAGRTRYQAHKCRTIINFPERGIDLTRYWLDNNNSKSPKEAPSELKPPFLYECYAAISHSGTTTQGGHYIALARSPDKNNLGSSKGAGPGDWHSFSDVSINNFSFSQIMSQEVVVLFLRRQKN